MFYLNVNFKQTRCSCSILTFITMISHSSMFTMETSCLWKCFEHWIHSLMFFSQSYLFQVEANTQIWYMFYAICLLNLKFTLLHATTRNHILRIITIKQNKKQRGGHLFNKRVIVQCLIMAQRQRLVNILSKAAP